MKQQPPKPRNPFVQHIVRRKQGAHQKPYKVSRRDAKAQLKRDCSDKPQVFLSSLNGPLVEWFNKRFLISRPGFDSQRVHQSLYAVINLLCAGSSAVEQRPLNPHVEGSIPSRHTTLNNVYVAQG